MQIAELHSKFISSKGVSTDTRKIEPGQMFFALKGDNFDGNTYAEFALEKGAEYCILDNPEYILNEKCILVKDVLETLQNLAHFHRIRQSCDVLALTGSNGKTTTKELINAVLSTKFQTVATTGNLNNHIGVPLTLLNIAEETEIAIIEMGANHIGEIALLCKIAAPDFGLITNFGKAHLEGFGSVEGVIKGKSELYDYLKKEQGTIFYNSDDPIQRKQIGDFQNIVEYSSNTIDYSKISLKKTQPTIEFKIEDQSFSSNLSGDYNFKNILASLAIGDKFGITKANMAKAISEYTPNNNRSQWVEKGGNQYYMDAYNANPSSMAASISNFSNLDFPKKIVILGDMFELGTEAEIEHQTITELAESFDFEKVFLVGYNFAKCETKNKNTFQFKTFDELKDAFNNFNPKEFNIFIKGSRGMALERLLN
ncbi:UDP-N-acetylmuramoyl-tripeptide--D-alanyl-D-alanine ligase [Aegicerativicinus sediminis]|uniref:UDP-N-acetylmuramoyl-tripeptide--D-alanyl-D- alanine ligase n=1 Tax=Aegicerativicinus sediminis TaxID=2893202 RepID=UPI001E536CA1|nr:UDP-N-acetylmuramoyl-tripeptide--D-alanyl-D-alanine ligase [Aegicerativicinus sediminis]